MQYQSKIIVSQSSSIEQILGLLNLSYLRENLEVIKSEEGSIGIKDVNSVAEKISKKNSSLKVILILNSEKLTSEAQNSLLKVLEEPNLNSILVLHTLNPDTLLPTIKSRCEIIFDDRNFDDSEMIDIEYIFKGFTDKSYKEKIKIVEKFLKDDNNKERIKKSILAILSDLAKKQSFVSEITKLEKAYKAIDANVNPKLIFDFIILSLESI